MQDLLPQHTEEEREALYEDIELHGLQTPVVIDEKNNIIDGRLRAEICQELKIDWLKQAELVKGLSKVQKEALRIKLNLPWRKTPPTQKQKREWIEVLLRAEPELSDGSIAEMVGSSQPTVWRVRKRLIQMNKLPRVAATVGRDGRKRKILRTRVQPQQLR
jgi:hypothetical protein